jgi:diguanylate cyclase (GGDEF)-like protein/PAS domain S-box-containing protein
MFLPHNQFRKLTISFVLFGFLLLAKPLFAQEIVKIGVLAYRPVPQTQAQWDPLATALNKAFPEYSFVVKVYKLDELRTAVADKQIDFILTNPGHYVLMNRRIGLAPPIATLANIEQGKPATMFGGVIFTRANRSDIHTLEDLRGKSFAATGIDSLGGYQAQAYELSRRGLKIPRDVRFIPTGMPHDNVVDAVLDGKADVGFVRSGVLEKMSREGKLDLASLSIINKQHQPDFSVLLSTQLYPEWPFATLPHTDKNLKRKVASFLLNLAENKPLAQALQIYGFDVPADYSSVEEVLRELRMPPFEKAPVFTAHDVWERYRWPIAAGLGASLLILSLGVRLLLINRRLRESELRFRTVADYTHDWEYWLGPDNELYFMSPSCESVTGYTLNEFLTNRDLLKQVVFPEDRKALDEHLQEVHQHLGIETVNFRIVRRDGKISWIEHICQPVFDNAGQYIGRRVANRDITDRKLAEAWSLASESRFRTIIESEPECIKIVDAQGALLEMNPAGLAMIEADSLEQVAGRNVLDVIAPEYREAYEDMHKRVIAGESMAMEYEVVGLHGGRRWLETHAVPMQEQDGKIVHLAVTRDISVRKQTESQLRIAATAFESQEGILVTDADTHILRVNQAFTRITGYTAEDVIGKTPRILASEKHDAEFYGDMWDSIHDHGAWEGEIWNRRKNGEIYPEHLNITAVKSPDGQVTNYVATMTDITVSKASAEKIKLLAFYDPLTQLPNRRLLMDRLQQALASSSRSGKEGAVLFIDLDNFKLLNDTLGHDTGDMLLQQVAERLIACVREGDTVARLGGDEFVVMLEDLSEEGLEAAAQTEVVANKILVALNEPYTLGQHEYRNTPSIGTTLFNEHKHKQKTDELLKQADIAMYQAKKSGRNMLRFFDPKMQESINNRVILERELQEALGKQQLRLHYQIQVDYSGHALGVEALIRWQHPERGLVPPAQFIPLAEETGQILSIGLWVLETACAQLQMWQKNELTRNLVLSVNVSAKQFYQVDFVAQVKATVRYHAINPSLLKLELTESMLLEDIEDTIATMSALKEFGIQFSLDDFGTGYSSLQYLKRLPLNQLKIDRSFVRDIAIDSSDQAIVRTIIAMAQSLELDYIAEGVETEEQRQLLLNIGCANYQGYLFGKPLPIGQFEALLTG